MHKKLMKMCDNEAGKTTLRAKDKYSKTCVKWPLKNRQNKDLNDKW